MTSLFAGACYEVMSDEPPAPRRPASPDGSPVGSRYLNRKWSGPRGDGLLVDPAQGGAPAPDDPAIVEARAYYASVGTLETRPGTPAPASWGDWLTAFGVPDAAPGEARPAYRARTGTAVFYNQNETALGHELGCQQFPAPSGEGTPSAGVACFLLNYGKANDRELSLPRARNGDERISSFGITYRPGFKPDGQDGYEVQFYAYGADGRRLDWAQLDTLGPRPVPQVCLGCHGGWYDEGRHLARFARFLPLHVDNLDFAYADQAPHDSREGQEEALRALNVLVARTPLTPRQRTALEDAYQGDPSQAGRVYHEVIPEGWRGDPEHEALYKRVVLPFCASCHDAEWLDNDGDEKSFYAGFASYDGFLSLAPLGSVCGSFSMPNAQAGSARFWAPSAEGSSPADAFLAAFGRTRDDCPGPAEQGD
ncbi:MAG TPA: hypothetical protein VFS43_27515 [Polyangiaceae bacterium]|nr:hypothetical protein [Polyangiaceae bacterium]